MSLEIRWSVPPGDTNNPIQLLQLFSLFLSDISLIGPYIQSPFNKALEAQRGALRRKPGETTVKVVHSIFNFDTTIKHAWIQSNSFRLNRFYSFNSASQSGFHHNCTKRSGNFRTQRSTFPCFLFIENQLTGVDLWEGRSPHGGLFFTVNNQFNGSILRQATPGAEKTCCTTVSRQS